MAIQIGKYKRPGIFIEEFDNSIISSPTVEGINNMVIGVSKKGPVNTPILLKNVNDLESIFGQLDRNLERKGSFYHRTVAKMLESTSVYAINLLITDDTLDQIEYQSLSAASNYTNDVERLGAYRRFFDTTGFWKRDTESFINLTKNNVGYNDRVLSITNLSDKYTTVFIVKSKLTGFDRTLIEWYGSQEKLPPYVNANDYASDYMVDVIIVGGDWSNYQELSVDNRWGAYFNSDGLRKDQIRNFANDRNVTLLSYYEGLSLIPYFRDANGKNIFIETTINRDTDRTGIFCAFNSELLEGDYPNGLVDLVGNGIVGVDAVEIDFLSYKETISQSVDYSNVILDTPGNVLSLSGLYDGARSDDHSRYDSTTTPTIDGPVQNGNRTGWFSEDYIFNLKSVTPTSTTTKIDMSFTDLGSGYSDSYAVIGGQYVQISGASFSILGSSYPNSGTTASYVVAFVVDGTGNLVMVDNVLTTTNPSVSTSDVVLGYVTFDIKNQLVGTSSVVYSPVSIDNTGYVNLDFNTDYTITDNSGSITVEFLDTANVASVKNYEQYRRIKMFNKLIDSLDGSSKDKMTMIINYTSMTKKPLSGMTITNVITSSTSNKSFTINTGLTSLEITDVVNNGYLLLYNIDNEFILNDYEMETKDEVANVSGTSSTGVISKFSEFYNDYYAGSVNSEDYFWSNLVENQLDQNGSAPGYGLPNIIFVAGEDSPSATASVIGYDYIVIGCTAVGFGNSLLANLDVNNIILVPSSLSNKGTFTIKTGGDTTAIALANTLGYGTSGYWAYRVNENVTLESLTGVSVVYDYITKHYLKMYLDGLNNLNLKFTDSLLQSFEPFNVNTNQTVYIQSLISNYKQSIEIEIPAGYTQTPNKILVNGSRYTEVKAGDFLEAYYDITNLPFGQVPKKLTRILTKRQYANDTSLVEITCDSRIATYNFSGDYQTFRYTSIEDYVSTYKAISLKGFRVRQDSLPDGTEARQNAILNLVAKGTPLFKAITNKEAIDFRYLIDSFGLGLTERSKQQLVDICGDRLDAFGFMNMPSMRSFKNSSSPSFVDAEGVLQLEFVSKGGDPLSSPAFLYSFGDGAGTTCTGFFLPYMTVSDNGRPVEVPPAMFAATTYMRKHLTNSSSITPWTIAAGVTNGKITNIAGLEMDFTPSDIEFINQAQMNPIVFKRNRGYIIETENTAQTLYKSALSYIHVREVLIELERELSRMLLDFQWKFNTADIRAEIKLRADVICETYVSRNGLYNYFNKIDEENNTPDVIDNQIGVLDTYVEPIKGMGIIVNNITILRTGAISAGGFING
jgi:hypothetical protein